MDGAWCILRCAGRATLPLAQSLADDGFGVWTPVETARRRIPRRRAIAPVEIPITPTFLFALADQLEELLALARYPVRRNRPPPRSGIPAMHDGFSVFHYLDRIPLIADAELANLRAEEGKTAPKAPAPVFQPGDDATVPGVAFGGMTGVVESSDGKFAMVDFGGRIRLKISTFILKPIMANNRAQPEKGIAA